MALTHESQLPTALLISGSGTTAEAIIQASQNGKLTGTDPVIVIASRPNTEGISRAHALGTETLVLQKKAFETEEAFGEELLGILQNLGVELVSQNGWMVKTPTNVILNFQGMIINQHPGPLDSDRPGFGGHGMYGSRVTAAVLAYFWAINKQEPFTETTTHHVTPEYDDGQIIRTVQLEVPTIGRSVSIAQLTADHQHLLDVTNLVQAQLLSLEHLNAIAVLQHFANGNLPKFSREKPLIPPQHLQTLEAAKQLAKTVFPQG